LADVLRRGWVANVYAAFDYLLGQAVYTMGSGIYLMDVPYISPFLKYFKVF
jgi:hypothetical protein